MKCFNRENQFTQAQSSATNRTLTLGRIKMCVCHVHVLFRSSHGCRATSNLYVLVQKRTPLAAKHTDTLSQLQKIQEFIMDLQDVTDEYEKNLEIERDSLAKSASASP